MAERHAAVLARLTALALELAERVQAAAIAAEAAEDLDRLAGAFHRVSRSVRLSMALEAKLARAARAEAREDARQEASASQGEPPRPPEPRRFLTTLIEPRTKQRTGAMAPRRDPVTGAWAETEYEDWVEGRPSLRTVRDFDLGEDYPEALADLDLVDLGFVDPAAAVAAVQARIAHLQAEVGRLSAAKGPGPRADPPP